MSDPVPGSGTDEVNAQVAVLGDAHEHPTPKTQFGPTVRVKVSPTKLVVNPPLEKPSAVLVNVPPENALSVKTRLNPVSPPA